ncbi:hypothetical protein D3C76_1824500 [compost metagenome]
MPPVFFADLKHTLAATDAGIVEHHIDHAEGCFSGIEGGFHAGAFSDIEGYCQGLAAFALNCLGQLP